MKLFVLVTLSLFVSIYSYGQPRVIDQVCDHRNAQVDVYLIEKIPEIFEAIRGDIINYISVQGLSKNITKALIQRVSNIPPLTGNYKIKYCGKKDEVTTFYYAPLANVIKGCLNIDDITTEEQLKLALTHEFAHSFDPCSYDVGLSPLEFNFNNVGYVLGYSDKTNYQSSFAEFPFKKIQSCIPKKSERADLHVVNAARLKYGIMCAVIAPNEFFADVVAADIVMKNLAQEHKKISISRMTEQLCPTHKIPITVTAADGTKTIMREWYDRAIHHPSFSERHSILYSAALSYGLTIEEEIQPLYNYTHCF